MTNNKFDRMARVNCDDLPEDVKKLINDMCTKILITATVDYPNQALYPANITLGGMQKACAILVSNFFKEEDVIHVAQALCNGIMDNLNTWKRPDLQAELFDEKPQDSGS